MSWSHVAGHIAGEAPELSALLAKCPPDASVEALGLVGRAGEATSRRGIGVVPEALFLNATDAHVDALVSALQIQGVVPALRHLECRNHPGVGDGAAAAFGRLLMDSECVLETLDLTGCEFTGAGCAVLCSALERNDSVRVLKLGWNPLGRQGGLALADMLRYNDRIEELGLCNTGLDMCSMVQIMAVLREHPSLRSVDLQKAILFSREDDTTMHGAALVGSNRCLVSLNLANTCVGDHGVDALVRALPSNETLKHLLLKNNHIGPVGAVAFAGLLKSPHCALWTLDLSANRVGDDGAEAMGEALAENTVLRCLDLATNRIGDRGLTAIAKGMSINSSLSALRLWGNDFPAASSETMGGDTSTVLLYKLLVGRWSHLEVETDLEPYTIDGALHLAFAAPSTRSG